MAEITFYALALCSAVVWLAVRGLVYLKTKHISWKREKQLLGLVLYILLILRGVWFPLLSPDGRPVRTVFYFGFLRARFNINLSPFNFLTDFYPGWQMNVVGNVLLFIPVGILFPMCFKKVDSFWKALLVGFASTFVIEFTQLFLRDRCSDVDDLILNTLGAAIGAVIWFGCKKYKRS